MNNENNFFNNDNNEIENKQNEYQSYSPYGSYYTQPRTVQPIKNERAKFSFKTLICSCIICAIVSCGVSVGTVTYFSGRLEGNSSSNTTINVDKASTNVVSAIAQKAIPSVVGIKATATTNGYFFFGSAQSSDEGSGVIYSKDGYIITNYHVISIAQENKSTGKISVYLSSNPEEAIEAKIVGYDEDYDLAVIKIEKDGLEAISFADSNDISVGDMAVAIGNPGGLDYMSSVSSGIISGLNRTIQLEGTTQMKLIQTDAAINPGNSGGALVNSSGELIGINSSKISSEEYEGMGFAIPSNTVKKQVNNIINNKDKKYAYVGVKISTDYSSEDLISMGYPAGAVIESVDEGSPADNSGIKEYDIITKFGDTEITDYNTYNNERLKHKPGDTVNITIYRNGKSLSGQITLGESNN